MVRKNYIYLAIILIAHIFSMSYGYSMIVPEEIEHVSITLDTIPVKDRMGNFINDPKINPFDITPNVVEQSVEYDPESGNYIIYEKIGDEFYRTPNYMTFQQFLEWKTKEDEQKYFRKLAGINTGYKSKLGKLDPLSKIDIKKNLIDRLFGGTDISIQPQGNVDLSLGMIYNINGNPYLTTEAQRNNGPLLDFDMDIRMSVDGKIGDKMKLGFNYDTQATFDFDKKMKLEYDSEQFTEDDIIKKIEAGNVSFPLKSTLIQGVESLFGLKTDLQFGHLKISAIASQQRSKQKNLRVQNGAVEQDFEIRPDEYDENRHFFVSHYHRDNYEHALSNLPQIIGLTDISEMEVWVTISRNDPAVNQQPIVALADLGEGDSTKMELGIDTSLYLPRDFAYLSSRNLFDNNGKVLPDNRANPLYDMIYKDDNTRKKDAAANNLKNIYHLKQTSEFELFTGRKLRSDEYRYHPKLGIISLNQRLRPEQVLAVGYTYNYRDEILRVGDRIVGGNTSNVNNDNEPEPKSVKYLKMLKSSNQVVRRGLKTAPSWNLMMKNVYSLGTAQLNEDGFQFDIFFEDNTNGSIIRFLPEKGFDNRQLLDIFNLDRLNTRLDKQQDGVFDFIPGVTVIPRTGSIIFPVLEPFGLSLEQLLVDPLLVEEYAFKELYVESKAQAEKFNYKNRFLMKGRYKSNVTSEISLGAFNVPRGSVHVSAGGVNLIEGVDYEINYGLGYVKIINTSYLSSGQPINIRFEDNATFSTQQKNMLGLRAEYEISKKMHIGATYLRLFEKPYTEKVNLGEDPINNRMFGLDFGFGEEVPFITRMLDKLPFYSTKAPSSINFSTEVAVLKPGHSSAINLTDDDGGIVNIDDFEGATSKISLFSYGVSDWVLASVPPIGSIDSLNNDLEIGANRALLNWYSSFNRTGSSPEDSDDPYTREVRQEDLFDRQISFSDPNGQRINTFNLSYFPSERGPYNFDRPVAQKYGSSAGVILDPDDNISIKLEDPASRWGGVMRSFQNTDFEALNVEYLEFWLLDPFMDRKDGYEHDAMEEGELVIQMGNISEDILRDGSQFYENSLPTDTSDTKTIKYTAWGKVPFIDPISKGFNKTDQTLQDLGYDGLNDTEEQNHFADYVALMQSIGVDISDDPSNDNFVSVDDAIYDNVTDLVTKYKGWNGPQGNSQYRDGGDSNFPGNPQAESEDLNDNKSMEQGESYYEYQIGLNTSGTNISDHAWVTQTTEVIKDGLPTEHWYRFRIPINGHTDIVNGIEGFRSMRFIRLYVTGFTQPKILRFAEMELVRNQWKRNDVISCQSDKEVSFSVDQVTVFDNSGKEPFGYVLPKGVKQQRLYNTIDNVTQDEKSLLMEFCDMGDSCEASIFKLSQMDLRQFENLQMFVHGEDRDSIGDNHIIEDGEFNVFIKIGKDSKNNYYEYELPLTISRLNDTTSLTNQERIWRKENMFDFPLTLFTELKKKRNKNNISYQQLYEELDPDNPYGGKVKIIGNPSLGYVKEMQIGIRKIGKRENQDYYCGEVWINELRLNGFKEQGGVAATAQLDLQLADLGTLSATGNYSSVGWGAIDKKLNERQKEEIIDYSVATNLQLGKLLPKALKLNIPFYAQYSQEFKTPQYDPYDLDLTVDEKLANTDDPIEQQDIKDRAQDKTTIKTFNFTNVKREKSGGKGTPKPWDVSNLSASYAYTKVSHTDFLLAKDEIIDQRAGLDYSYSYKAKPIKPFKFIKSKSLKFISDINFNPLPSSLSISNQLQRFTATKTYRLPKDFDFTFDDKRFDWNRRYNLKWNLMRDLKMTFSAENVAVIDELREVGIVKTGEERKIVDVRGNELNASGTPFQETDIDSYWKSNFTDFGRNKAYNHQLKVDYTLPTRNIPFLSFMTIKAGYKSNYAWDAASLAIESLGNVVNNGQGKSLNVNMSFDKLYNKSKYLKGIQKTGKSKKSKNDRNGKRGKSKKGKDSVAKDNGSNDKKSNDKKKKKKDGPSIVEKVLLRPLLLLRSVKFTYKQDLTTLIPGLNFSPKYFGVGGDQFSAPGWDFVFGAQPNISDFDNNPNNWLNLASKKGWISTDPQLNQKVLQTSKELIEAKIVLEPIKSMKINLSFKKSFINNHSQLYGFNNAPSVNDFQHVAAIDHGSFETTFFTMNTLFGGQAFNIEDNKERINQVFATFKDNREEISRRLAAGNPTTYIDSTHVNNDNYEFGFGDVSNEVLIPAFLAAYQGVDASTIELDLKDEISRTDYIPRPNWTLKYDGLAKMRWFRDIFKVFSISHGYKSVLKVSDFRTNQEFEQNYGTIDSISNNYLSRIEIPAIRIQEAFNPIIGIDIETSGGMKLNFEYNKKRDLSLETTTKRLQESNTQEMVFGFGYVLKNIDIPFLTGSKKSKKRRGKKKSIISDRDDDKNTKGKKGSKKKKRKKVTDSRGNNLTIKVDFSIRDDVRYVHDFSLENAREDRGSKTITFGPNVEYDVHKNLSLVMFFDYRKTIPYLTSSYTQTSMKGGLKVRFKLN